MVTGQFILFRAIIVFSTALHFTLLSLLLIYAFSDLITSCTILLCHFNFNFCYPILLYVIGLTFVTFILISVYLISLTPLLFLLAVELLILVSANSFMCFLSYNFSAVFRFPLIQFLSISCYCFYLLFRSFSWFVIFLLFIMISCYWSFLHIFFAYLLLYQFDTVFITSISCYCLLWAACHFFTAYHLMLNSEWHLNFGLLCHLYLFFN